MSKPSCICPKCGSVVYILSSKVEKDVFNVVCPICFLSFRVRSVLGVNTKTGLPQGERYEPDLRDIT
jgi:hypothetical protein